MNKLRGKRSVRKPERKPLSLQHHAAVSQQRKYAHKRPAGHSLQRVPRHRQGYSSGRDRVRDNSTAPRLPAVTDSTQADSSAGNQSATNEIAETAHTAQATPSLFANMCERESLQTAWQEIRKGRGVNARRWSGAADRVSLDLFERSLPQRLTNLRYQLLSGRYRPDPIVNFRLPKPGGGHRVLSILTVRDRVAQRAALNVIVPLFEPEFLPCSFGFRPDRSTRTALDEVEKVYREGYRWAVDADIEAFFDNIERGRLVRLLKEKISDPVLVRLLKLWLNNPRQLNREPEMPSQSAPTSPQKPGLAPTPNSALAPSQPEGSLVDRLTEFTRLALEGGLDWGISALSGGQAGSSSGYYRASQPYGWFRDEEEDDWRTPTQQRSQGNTGQEALKRLGMEGALTGLWLAKRFVRHGGALGKVAGASAALGTVGSLGLLAHRVWKNRQSYRNAKDSLSAAPPEEGRLSSERARGIAQGSILSPLYSNIYLHEFDLKVTQQGYRLVRFADDLVILCRSGREAEEALAFAEVTLGNLGLHFKPAKTAIRPLEKGFKFLGAEMAAGGKWKVESEANPRQMPVKEWAKKVGAGWLRRKPTTGVIQQGRKVPLENVEEEED